MNQTSDRTKITIQWQSEINTKKSYNICTFWYDRWSRERQTETNYIQNSMEKQKNNNEMIIMTQMDTGKKNSAHSPFHDIQSINKYTEHTRAYMYDMCDVHRVYTHTTCNVKCGYEWEWEWERMSNMQVVGSLLAVFLFFPSLDVWFSPSKCVARICVRHTHTTHYGGGIYRPHVCMFVSYVLTWVRSTTFTHTRFVCLGFFPSPPPSSSYSHVIWYGHIFLFLASFGRLTTQFSTQKRFLSSVSFHSLSADHFVPLARITIYPLRVCILNLIFS